MRRAELRVRPGIDIIDGNYVLTTGTGCSDFNTNRKREGGRVIKYCQTHYNLLQERWNGKLATLYPDQEIVISETDCDYLYCRLNRKPITPFKGDWRVAMRKQ